MHPLQVWCTLSKIGAPFVVSPRQTVKALSALTQILLQGAGSAVLVPIMVFGCMMLLGGALLLLLPETHEQKLPDVIDDVEQPQSDASIVSGEVPCAEQELMEKFSMPNEPEEHGVM